MSLVTSTAAMEEDGEEEADERSVSPTFTEPNSQHALYKAVSAMVSMPCLSRNRVAPDGEVFQRLRDPEDSAAMRGLEVGEYVLGRKVTAYVDEVFSDEEDSEGDGVAPARRAPTTYYVFCVEHVSPSGTRKLRLMQRVGGSGDNWTPFPCAQATIPRWVHGGRHGGTPYWKIDVMVAPSPDKLYLARKVEFRLD